MMVFLKQLSFSDDGLVIQLSFCGDGLVRQEHVYADSLVRQEFVAVDGLVRQECHCVWYGCVGIYGSRFSLCLYVVASGVDALVVIVPLIY